MQYGTVGYYDGVELRGKPGALARASKGWIPYGTGGLLRAWKGVRLNFPVRGARQMFPFRNGWAGLDDTTSPATTGRGSVFSPFFGMAVYVGNGQLIIDGVVIPGAIASSIVRLLLKYNGSYTHALSGPYTAGIAEPSAPQAFTTTGASSLVPNWIGSLSFKIAGYRTTTFGRSRASERSVEIVLNGNAPALVIPLASVGVTNWAIFSTKLGGATQGLHYRMARPNPHGTSALGNLEFLESDIQRNIVDASVTISTDLIDTPTDTFTQADVGKRVSVTSGGAVFPNPTTVIEVISPTQARVSQDATTGSADFAFDLIAYALGRDRCVLLNYADSELTAEVAWIDDFVPPPCSHAAALEKVWIYVTGGDSKGGVDTSNGSILQFSNRNYFESVNPFWRMYLPDAVVDVLQRGIDNYLFVGLSTMIIAFQYIETIDTAPAAGTVILQSAGIKSPTNWCLRDRFLYVMAADGNFLRIGEGGAVDSQFSAPVTNFIKTWTDRSKIIVSSHPNGQSVMLAYETQTLLFNEETNEWSTRLDADEFVDGHAILGAVATDSELILTIQAKGGDPPRRAYKYDRRDTNIILYNAGTNAVNGVYSPRGTSDGKPYYNLLAESDDPNTNAVKWTSGGGGFWRVLDDIGDTMYESADDVDTPDLITSLVAVDGVDPVPDIEGPSPRSFTVASTEYFAPAERFPAVVNEVFADLKTDLAAHSAYLALHRNYQPMYFEDITLSVVSAKLRATLPGANLTANHIGYYLLIQGADGLSGNGYGFYRIKEIVSSTICILTPGTTEDMSQAAYIASGPVGDWPHCLFAFQMFTKNIVAAGVTELVNQQSHYLAGCYAYAISVAFATECAGDAMPLNARLGGEIDTYFQGQLLP